MTNLTLVDLERLRDEFAKAALQALIERYNWNGSMTYEIICEEAYKYANQMMITRND